MRDHIGILMADNRSQITSNWQSFMSCVTKMSGSIDLYVVRNQLSNTRSDSCFVALVALNVANLSLKPSGQICALGRVKPQKCCVNGGFGGRLFTGKWLFTKQAIITISLRSVFGCNAVRTFSVIMTSGGGAAHFVSVETVMLRVRGKSVGARMVIASLHHVDLPFVGMKLRTFNQHGPLILQSSNIVSSEFVCVPKMCAIDL